MANTNRLAHAAALLALLGVPTLALGQAAEVDDAVRSALGGDPAVYRQVVEGFQAAVRAGDAQAAAGFVSYPIGVTIDGARRSIASAADFVAAYPKIVTPAIAASIGSVPYAGAMVNDQGLMLGDGEVWVGGVCRDDACATPDVKVMTIQSTDSEPGGAAAPALGPLETYHDWVMGCDNRRSCIALGLAPQDGIGGYLAIRRDAGAEAVASLTFTVLPPDGVSAPEIGVAVAGGKSRFAPARFAAQSNGEFLSARAPDAAVAGLIAALIAGETLDLTAGDGAPAPVSLRGATAALLRLDDLQGRVGTVTALIRRGDAPAASVPPAPSAPAAPRRVISALPDPLPALPAGIPAPTDDSCSDSFAPVAYKLSDTETLWGVCAQAGAYNIDYSYWILGPGGAAPARFVVADAPTDDASILTNANLAPDGLALKTIALGRGLGDCGVMADWAWTGAEFVLVQYRELDACMGVLQDDWPVRFVDYSIGGGG